MTVPQIETVLPELVWFTAQLVARYQHGSISGWQGFNQQVREFFTPAMMNKVERVIPEWGHMSSYAEQQTLIHVVSVLSALQMLPEYVWATREQQSLMTWMVLFHDLGKVPRL
jgi:hypothetical protein